MNLFDQYIKRYSLLYESPDNIEVEYENPDGSVSRGFVEYTDGYSWAGAISIDKPNIFFLKKDSVFTAGHSGLYDFLRQFKDDYDKLKDKKIFLTNENDIKKIKNYSTHPSDYDTFRIWIKHNIISFWNESIIPIYVRTGIEAIKKLKRKPEKFEYEFYHKRMSYKDVMNIINKSSGTQELDEVRRKREENRKAQEYMRRVSFMGGMRFDGD